MEADPGKGKTYFTIVSGESHVTGQGQASPGADRMGPSATRGHDRSRCFSGFANAMADQWGAIAAKLTAKATVTQLELFA